MSSIRDYALRKVVYRFIPLLFAGAIMANLDRFNVSMAALKMNQDIGLSPSTYGFGAGVFFIIYALCEIPSNVALGKFGARRWIARIMVTWGLITIGTAFVSGPTSFLLNRALLGAAEAGFQPGVLAFLALWFPAEHRTRIFAYFLMAAPVAVAIGGPIAGLLVSLEGTLGLHGWQWLFIVEGVPPIVIGLLVWKCLRDHPSDAEWLSKDEIDSLTLSSAEESRPKPGFKSMVRALMTPTVFLSVGVLSCLGGINHAVTFWLPQIIKSAGLSTMQTGFASALPYATGTLALFLWSRQSDRTGAKRWQLALPAVLAGAALAASVFVPGLGARMTLVTIAMTCVFSIQAIFWSTVSKALPNATRTVGLAAINAGAAMFAFVAPTVIGISRQLTGNFDAAFAVLGLMGVAGAVMATALIAQTPSENRMRDQTVA